MRKAACLLCAMILFAACAACAPRVCSPAQVRFVFSAKAQISYEGGAASCNVSREGPGMADYAFDDGLRYNWGAEGFSTEFAGLLAQSGACTLPKNNFAVTLNRFLDYAARQDALTPCSATELAGSMDGVGFTITVDDVGNLLELSAPEITFHTSFSGLNT